ncbi:triose-phosphate isomerase [Patescibacteria group bacterium]|nr:triose-phosphate isomerase [Patescibacteria group bacterium]
MSKLILANFKSNKSIIDTNLWFEKFLKNIDDSVLSKLDVSVAPSFVALVSAEKVLEKIGKNVSLSIQNISSFPAGSYTGAISGQNLSGLKIKYAVVGHSERRKYFGEKSSDVALKVTQSLQNGIMPILCVDTEYLEEQFGLIDKKELEKCIVAYEPISAIGTGKNADVGKVKGVVEKVKRLAGNVPIIYGGSVDEFNINEYLMVTDGALVGTASLDADQFQRLLEAVS